MKKPKRKRRKKKINQEYLQDLIDAAEERMEEIGFSENRKIVARQGDGLRNLLEIVCDENLCEEERGKAYLAYQAGVNVFATMPKSEVDRIAEKWKRNGQPEQTTT